MQGENFFLTRSPHISHGKRHPTLMIPFIIAVGSHTSTQPYHKFCLAEVSDQAVLRLSRLRSLDHGHRRHLEWAVQFGFAAFVIHTSKPPNAASTSLRSFRDGTLIVARSLGYHLLMWLIWKVLKAESRSLPKISYLVYYLWQACYSLGDLFGLLRIERQWSNDARKFSAEGSRLSLTFGVRTATSLLILIWRLIENFPSGFSRFE